MGPWYASRVLTLALDTSTLTGSVAVLDGATLLAELSCRVRANHSEHLLDRVRDALTYAGVALSAIGRVAVGVGPGSFTGVRIGMATAKGLALGQGIALVGVSSLVALARPLAWVERTVIAALDARRGEVYSAVGAFVEGRWSPAIEGMSGTPEAIGARMVERGITGPVVLVGDLSDDFAERISRSAGVPVARAVGFSTPLARFVGTLVDEGFGVIDQGALEPSYLRGADAKLPAASTDGRR